jgi:hypothetical protein
MNGTCLFPLFALKRDSDFDYTWIVVAALVVVAAVATFFVIHRIRKAQSQSHYALFSGLCRVHELDSNSKKLLSAIAEQYQIEKPVRLFLEPNWLDRARAEKRFPEYAELIDALKAKLFG